MHSPAARQIVVGFDGSPAASAAINTGALLLSQAHAWITNLWAPPLTDETLRNRLWRGRNRLDDFLQAAEREGEWRAGHVADMGVALARAAGWQAEPLLRRVAGGKGIELAQLVDEIDPDVVLVGARGLSGVRAVLGSVSDAIVHYSPKPVLVAAHPMLSTDHAALADGPIVIGWDASPGAAAALASAEQLMPDRRLLLVNVHDDTTSDATADPPTTSSGRVLTLGRIARGQGTATQAVAGALVAFAQNHKAALLVVGSRGRSAVEEILLGSVAMATLHHAHRPVLVVPSTGH